MSLALPHLSADRGDGQIAATNIPEGRVENLLAEKISVGETADAKLAVASSGRTAILVDASRSELRIVDLTARAVTGTLALPLYPSAVALTDSSDTALVGYSGESRLDIINLRDLSIARTISLPAAPGRLIAASTVQKAIVTLPAQNAIGVIDLESGAVSQIYVGREPSALALDPATLSLVVTSRDDNTLTIVDLISLSVVATLPTGPSPSDVAIDSGTGIAYVACSGSGIIERFDIAQRAALGALDSQPVSGLARLAVFPDSAAGTVRCLLVASSNLERSLAVFNLVKGSRWRIQAEDYSSDLGVSAATGRVVTLSEGAGLLALDIRPISPPVVSDVEALTPGSVKKNGVVISGHNFLARSSKGLQSGTIPDPEFAILVAGSQSTDATILDDSTAHVFSGAELRRVPFQVQTANGPSNIAYLKDPDLVPLLSSISPARGPESGGTLITIKGDGFLDGSPGTISVVFGTRPASKVKVVDANTIQCMSPPGSDSVPVKIRNSQGVSAESDFVYLPPGMSINDVTVTEGNSGTVDAVFNVTLDAASTTPVTVDYATADGTATAGSDYVTTSGTLTFASGTTSQSITVTVNGDTETEPAERLYVNLSNPVDATFLDPQGRATITNDDGQEYLSIDSPYVTEGHTGTVNAVFNVTLSAASAATVTVDYATADATATALADYVTASGTLTFAPGTTSQSVTVVVNGDTDTEPTEIFHVNLSNPSNATLYIGDGVGTITNDDGNEYFYVNSPSISEGQSGTVNLVFTVTLAPASATTTNVDYATIDGTALAPSDYVSTSGTLTFAPGTTTQTITVLVNGDTVGEPQERFFVNLSNPVNAILYSGYDQGSGYINNDDGLEYLSAGSVTVTEGNSGTVNAVFNVTLSAASATTVTVDYATTDGTATAGSDYVATSGTLTFAPGTTSQPVTVLVNGDTVGEPAERFFVNLSNPVSATIYYNQGVGTINNDDGLEYLSTGNATVTEGNSGTVNAVFDVTLSAASATTVTVDYATADGEASAGSDYVATSGTLTFAPGTTTRTITVVVNGDTVTEPIEKFYVNLSNPVSATLYINHGTGTINNDDGLEYFSAGSATVTEGNSGTVNAVFNVTLSAASATTVSVDYATADGGATAGSDYVATSGTLTFAPGTTSRTITVVVNSDTVTEPIERFYLNLLNPVSATIYSNQGTGTINNDDGLEYFSAGSATVTEGNSGTINAVFNVTLSAASATTVRVDYATADATATAGSDYVATSGTLTFNPGITSQSITVIVNGDTVTEPTERFYVNLSNPVSAYIYINQGTGTITNDDGLQNVSIISSVTVTEGDSGTVNANFTVTLSAASAATVRVDYATADGTATAGSDYVSASGTLTFAPGTTSQPITVQVNGDTVTELNEQFYVNLSNPISATINTGHAPGTINDDDSSLSINDVTLIEGDGGTLNATFTVTLSASSSNPVTVNFDTIDGTATAPADYSTTRGTLTFTPGSTSRTITVPVAGETAAEGVEFFYVDLSSATGASISDARGQGDIIDNDGGPNFSINDVSVAEGNSGTRNLVFTVTRTPYSTNTETVDYSTADGTAVAPGDYIAKSGTLTFPPALLTQTVTITVNGDSLDEPNEIVNVNLTNPSTGTTISKGTGKGTITDDDAPAYLLINNINLTEGNAGTKNATFTVTLAGGTNQTVTVNYATSDGTASASSDYVAASGVLTFAPGITSQTVSIIVNGDTLTEPNEIFYLNLSNPSNATLYYSDSQAQCSITNDDGLETLSAGSRTVTEGDTGTINAVFAVTLSAASAATVTVQYATSDGSATAGSDYVAASGTLTFPPGTTSQSITVAINGDTLTENNENFYVNIFNPTNATIYYYGNQGTGAINNDDGLETLSAGNRTVTEGNTGTVNAVFNVTLSAASATTVTVQYATSDGTAAAGSDYVATSGTLTFAPGTTTQTITVVVNGDTLTENNETFFVNLSNPTNATLYYYSNQGAGSITNDDGLEYLYLNNRTVTEGHTGTVNAVFNVTLSGASATTVTVQYATSDGTAKAGSDYVAASGTLTFAPGTTVQTITVVVNGDTLTEDNETFFVNLSNPTNATLYYYSNQGAGSITNDDGLEYVYINNPTVTEGHTGTVNAVFNVTLSAASATTVTVQYATSDGTAAAGSDYLATSGTLTFTPGTTSQNVTVVVNGDTLTENNEIFHVNLFNPTNATLYYYYTQGTSTIYNDDGLEYLYIDNPTVTEGHTGTVNAVFAVTLSAASATTVTVQYVTSDGTAAAGSDYVATSGTLTFAPGTTSQNVTVAVNGDTLTETSESFHVNIFNPTNATLYYYTGHGTATISNDDALQYFSISNPYVTEGNTGTVDAVFNVALSSASPVTVTVQYATLNGTALAGTDYVATSGTLTFAPGTIAQSVTVPVNGDTLTEQQEYFNVNLSNPTNAILYNYYNQGRGTIYDNDSSTLSINDVSVTEGNSGTINAVFTVTLFPASTSSTAVNYSTANGSASSPSDYLTTSGSLIFAPGVTTQTITVVVNGDTLVEGNEIFYVNLSSADGASVTDSFGIGTILTDDSPSLSIDDISINEGNTGTTNFVFTVSLSPSSPSTVTVSYATADGTATQPGDYLANSGTLTFAPGVTTRTISVVVNGDAVWEAGETFAVNLSGEINATITDSLGLATILNDDGIPTLSINDVTVTEGNSGTVNALFTVTLSAASASTVTVDYATADSTATAPVDYAAASGTLTFAPGNLTQTITVVVNGDVLDELPETFLVNLTNPTNAMIADGQGAGSIPNDDLTSSLSITDVLQVEGDSGTTFMIFNVNLSPASTSTVTVNFATADASATAPGDYLANSATLTFAPGSVTQSITVVINGDTVVEPDETFAINLSGATNATIADNQGVGTIRNDDNPGITIGDVIVTESNSGAVNALFTVSLSVASSNTVTVNYATSDGTATAPSDYGSRSGLLTFPPGVVTQSITVVVTGDSLVEPDETFYVDLSGATNATITDNQGLGTILNDDNPSLSISDVVVTEGNAGTVAAVFTVTLSPTTPGTVTVNYSADDGTASSEGSDFDYTSGTLTFAPGTSTQIITVTVNGDTRVEGNETFLVNLSAASGAAISDSQGIGTIIDDDAVLRISDVSVVEGNAGSIDAIFTVTLSPASVQTVTVNYASADGTAVSPGDYLVRFGTLSFAPGVTTQTITIPVNGDTLVELDETFLVDLSNPTNASIADAQGLGTIRNDDTPTLSIADATVTEGNAGTVNAAFSVTLSAPTFQTVTVNYATADGTAGAGADYIATSGTLTFAPGVTVQNLLVTVNGDVASEPDESFTVGLSNAFGAAILDGQAVGTITNDDVAPRLSIDDVTLVESNSGTSNAVFTVTLSAPVAQTVTVNYATANGIATAGSDYAATGGTLTFAPGSTVQNITVIVSGDVANEADETFFVNLSGATSATIAKAQGIGTITNDDAAPRLSISDASVVEGNGNPVSASFSVTLTSAALTAVTVNFATADGSAVAGSDYVATSGTLTFAPGSVSQTIAVSILGDILGEGNENFSVNLSAAVNATIADGFGSGTITDDDAGGTVQFSSATLTIGEGSGSASIAVTRTGGDAGGAAVDFATSDGSAAAGLDYTSASGTIVFAAGETSRSLTVPILDDAVFEGNETFNLILSNARGGANLGAPSIAVLVIAEDDPAPGGTFQFNVTAYRVNENASNAVITVTRSGEGLGAASVNYATSNGTATAPADYTAAFGTLNFAAGESSQTFNISIIDDTLVEGNETVNLTLNSPTNGASVRIPPTAVLTIIDNDNPVPILSGLTPSFGDPAGGTFVSLSGRYFTAGATVRFGSALASNVEFVAENVITCSTPAGTGTVAVSVTTLYGTTTLAGAFTYLAAPPAGTQLDWFPPEAEESAGSAAPLAALEDLPPPRDLKATRVLASQSATQANLSAPRVAVDLEGGLKLLSFNVYRSTDPKFIVSDESARLIANVPAGVTNYFDPDLSAMSGEVKLEPTYFYRVTALYERGESVQTNVATTGITITQASLQTIGGQLTLVLDGVSFATFRAQIQVDGVKLRQTRFPLTGRVGNGTSTRIEGVDDLEQIIAPGRTVRIVVVNPGENEDLSDAQFSDPFLFRRAP